MAAVSGILPPTALALPCAAAHTARSGCPARASTPPPPGPEAALPGSRSSRGFATHKGKDKAAHLPRLVTPAKAGVKPRQLRSQFEDREGWIPAFAGMTR